MHRALVEQAKQGDSEAFDALARLVGDRCMAIAHRILRDADLAADAVQAALITAWREMRTLRDPDLFDHFATVAQRAKIYTAHDYAAIVDHLVRVWKIGGRSVVGTAARAQDELCRLAERHHRLADRIASVVEKQPRVAFSWIRGREA